MSSNVFIIRLRVLIFFSKLWKAEDGEFNPATPAAIFKKIRTVFDRISTCTSNKRPPPPLPLFTNSLPKQNCPFSFFFIKKHYLLKICENLILSAHSNSLKAIQAPKELIRINTSLLNGPTPTVGSIEIAS